MLIILDRGEHQTAVQYGLGPVRDVRDALTFAEYTYRQTQRIIEEFGIPAAMFSHMRLAGVTTGRTSSSIPNMSAGSARRTIHDSEET